MRLLRILPSIFAIALFLVPVAHSSAIPKDFRVDRSVLDKGDGTQRAMNESAYMEYVRADKKLNEVYNQIRKEYKNNKKFIEKLIKAEKAWLAYRDAHMEEKFPEEDTMRYYGSIFPMVYHLELAEVTWHRVIQLYQWLNPQDGDVGAGSVGDKRK